MALSRRPPKTHDEPTQPPLEMPRPIQRPSARAPAVTGPAMATPTWGLCYSGSLTHGGQPGSPTPCCRLLAHPLLPPKMARSPAVEPVARGDRSRGVRRVGPCLGSSPGGLSFSVTQAWSLCDCDSLCDSGSGKTDHQEPGCALLLAVTRLQAGVFHAMDRKVLEQPPGEGTGRCQGAVDQHRDYSSARGP